MLQGQLDLLVAQAQRVMSGLQDQLDRKVFKVYRAMLDRQGLRATQAHKALWVLPVLLVAPVILAHKAQQDLLVHKVFRVMSDQQGHRAFKVFRAFRVLQDQLAQQVLMAHQLQALQDQQARLVPLLALLGQTAQLDLLALLVVVLAVLSFRT